MRYPSPELFFRDTRESTEFGGCIAANHFQNSGNRMCRNRDCRCIPADIAQYHFLHSCSSLFCTIFSSVGRATFEAPRFRPTGAGLEETRSHFHQIQTARTGRHGSRIRPVPVCHAARNMARGPDRFDNGRLRHLRGVSPFRWEKGPRRIACTHGLSRLESIFCLAAQQHLQQTRVFRRTSERVRCRDARTD